MAYEVTATRKRPQSFAQLVGQEFVSATLASSIRQGRIAHAYLFAGPRGVGKTSVARILARALNCEKGPTDTPCGTCASCQEIARGSSLDVIEIDGASNTSVNDVREIRDEVLFAPNAGRYKIYIIDEVHMLSNSAFNALLKTIEEPPPYIVFVFATTEAHKVPATIRSRCQQYNFRLISTAEIKAKLREASQELGVQAEERALIWIAKEATGSLRDAYTLLDQVVSFSPGSITLERIREKLGVLGIEELNDFVKLLRGGNVAAVLERADAILATGVSIEQLVADLAEYFRNLLFLKSGISKDTLLGYAPEDFDSSVLETLSLPQLERAIELLLSLYRNIRFSLNQRFELELTLSRLSQLDSLISASDIREALQEIRGEVLAAPGARLAAASPASAGAAASSASPEKKPDVQHAARMIADSLRREKPALASALEHVASVTLEGDEVVLAFFARDRFQGEVVLKDKDMLSSRFSALLSSAVRIKLEFREARQEPVKVDQRVELLRKVFRGEVVKGEGHGDESV
ncbi:MAG TPA: DNA polymerase III subunit gamma/tau [Spirochaetia bacterium]|nr:DNA polymerase III subunit gamma/tau [Spirochaetia bacterium]